MKRQTIRSLALAVFVSVGVFGCVEEDNGDSMVADMAVDAEIATQCTDGVDNDGDGLVDGVDPGCAGADDDDESDDPIPQCSDGEDNDGDGLTDFPNDPACAGADDDDESDDPPVPQCNDGIDNDEDGDVDLADRGCGSAADNDESDEPPLPQCSDGIDNDDDSFIDFPQDPGCGSEFDDDESNEIGPVVPQCSDGADNDGDGLTDLADPGCSSVADPRELDPEDDPACANGDDDDGDGIIDFPLDPGCSAAGDENEDDSPNVPQCGNGVDDDADGFIDYPNDPGCQGIGDRDETDPPVLPACSDGVDNDRDDQIDYPQDRGCESAADGSEGGACGRTYEAVELEPGRIVRGDSRRGAFVSEGTCGGRGAPEVVFVYQVSTPIEALVIRTDLPDNAMESTLYVRRGCLDPDTEVACNREPDGDEIFANSVTLEAPAVGEYYVFLDGAAGRGGEFAIVAEEVPLAECLNGIDDDGDNLADYPLDPGCSVPDDRDETDPDVLPACFDDEDNDGDGEVDFPLDAGCQSAADDDEVDVCGQGLRILQYPQGAPFVMGRTDDGTSDFAGSCGGDGPEKIHVFENIFNANLFVTVDFPETENRTSVYVRRACTDGGTELGCSTGDGEEIEQRGAVEIERAAPGTYYIFVDTQFGLGGAYKLAVQVDRLPPGCSDLVDNDEDGFRDADDVGCSGPEDEDERDPPPGEFPVCFDQVDNDDDGLMDYPFDPGCSGKGDDDEADPDVLPECFNGVDDDDDGLVDFPLDPGCASAGDDIEQGDRRAPECTNRIDDDNDGLIDYPIEPGCSAPGDLSEANDDLLPACADDRDNDRDGLIDYPFDPGCAAAGHIDEEDPEVPFACSNGMDDDGDDIVDFPFDPGCQSAAEDSEENNAFAPACANDIDDDGDGLTDFPQDRGCRFRGDTSEVDPFDPPSRCENSIDDDADGLIDLRDPGCVNRDDDDELDPGVVPQCANEIDDDEDGLIDWPDDLGCQARGDSPESQMCRQGVDVPDVAFGVPVLGTTLEAGADNYRNRCGGREAPDAVYRFFLEEEADVRISADNPGTDYPVVLSVTRDCEEARAQLGCAGDFRLPDPTVNLRNAEPGEYYVIVDGGGPERWASNGGEIAMPPDPRNFVARNDINNTSWSDGGNDAFDGYGRINFQFGGANQQLNVSLGQRQLNVGGYAFNLVSELQNNVWRVQLQPAVENDERQVTVVVSGNLGSDGSTQSQQPNIEFGGRNITYLFTHDGRPSDPPIVHMMVPSDPEQLDRITYAINRDNPTVTAENVTLPLTWYIALSYAPGINNPGVVAQALVGDLEIQAGGGGADAPRFGDYELTVDVLDEDGEPLPPEDQPEPPAEEPEPQPEPEPEPQPEPEPEPQP